MAFASRRLAATVAAFAALACTPALAGLTGELPPWARGGKAWRKLTATASAGNTTANWFPQLVDHTNPNRGTFAQRWYWDHSAWDGTANSPVLFYICGEAPCTGSPSGSVINLAQQTKSLIVALEHRWYGESLPGDITSTRDLMTLDVDQVMEDIPAFISYIEGLLGGVDRKWVAIGGSYPGALSAWIREKRPDVIDASWSSSGVVNAVYKFTRFDQLVAQAVGTECANSIRAVTAAMEAAWPNPTARAAMLALFGTPADFTQQDFAWMLADSAAMGAQYGFKDEMCSYLVPQPANVLAAFANWTNTHYGATFGASCYYSTACLSDPKRVAEWYDAKTWVWQCCYQLAYWQVAYPGSLRSKVLTLDYFQNQCSAAFGIPNMFANTTAFNARYGGVTPNATLVFATNGSDDPWQGACVESTISDVYLEDTAVCDGCGHCKDLHAPAANDPAVITQQRARVFNAIMKWIA